MNKIKITYALKRFEGERRDNLIPRLMIDGLLFHDELTVDLRDLAASVHSTGEYYILTCSCGEPSCAGLAEGIHVVHRGEQIIWRVANPFTQDLSEEPSEEISYVEYVFPKNEYIEAVESGINEAQTIIGRRKDLGFVPYGLREEDVVGLTVSGMPNNSSNRSAN